MAAFVGEVLSTHAYVPPSVMPTRDLQPGVVVLPPTVQLPANDEDADGDGDEDAGDTAVPVGGVQGGVPPGAGPGADAPSTEGGAVTAGDVHPEQVQPEHQAVV